MNLKKIKKEIKIALDLSVPVNFPASKERLMDVLMGIVKENFEPQKCQEEKLNATAYTEV